MPKPLSARILLVQAAGAIDDAFGLCGFAQVVLAVHLRPLRAPAHSRSPTRWPPSSIATGHTDSPCWLVAGGKAFFSAGVGPNVMVVPSRIITATTLPRSRLAARKQTVAESHWKMLRPVVKAASVGPCCRPSCSRTAFLPRCEAISRQEIGMMLDQFLHRSGQRQASAQSLQDQQHECRALRVDAFCLNTMFAIQNRPAKMARCGEIGQQLPSLREEPVLCLLPLLFHVLILLGPGVRSPHTAQLRIPLNRCANPRSKTFVRS